MARPPNYVIILKVFSLINLFIVTGVGCFAHFNNLFYDMWQYKFAREMCQAEPDCPSEAMPMERTFVVVTIICLVLSAVSFVLSFVVDASSVKIPDAGFHGVAGILILISGILMITAAIKIDDAVDVEPDYARSLMGKALVSKFTIPDNPTMTDWRKGFKYYRKLAAGSMAILNALLFFATSAAIMKPQPI